MMIYLVKKESGGIYCSTDIIHFIGKEYGYGDLVLAHDPLGAPQLVFGDGAADLDDCEGALENGETFADGSACRAANRDRAADACCSAAASDALPRFVSVTDTKHYWAAVLADEPVGLDMEERGRRVRPTTAKGLHPLEQQYLAGLSEESAERTREFLEVWTRKEAYM